MEGKTISTPRINARKWAIGTEPVDDIALEVVEDYMVDGSFQPYTNTV